MSENHESDSDSDNDNEKENKGLSMGSKVALGIGVGVAAIVGGYELFHHMDNNDDNNDDNHLDDIDDSNKLNDHHLDDKGYNYLHDYHEGEKGSTIIAIGRPGCEKSVNVKELIENNRELIENEYENIFMFNTESWYDQEEGRYIDKMNFWKDNGLTGLPSIIKKKAGDHDWTKWERYDYGDDLLDWMTS